MYRHIQINGTPLCEYDYNELSVKGVGHIRCGSSNEEESIANAKTMSTALNKNVISVIGHCAYDSSQEQYET